MGQDPHVAAHIPPPVMPPQSPLAQVSLAPSSGPPGCHCMRLGTWDCGNHLSAQNDNASAPHIRSTCSSRPVCKLLDVGLSEQHV